MLEVKKPSGPFAVGQCDCCWFSPPASDGDGEAGTVPNHKLMVRIFYPVVREASQKCQPGKWLPDAYGFGRTYAQAYADSLFKPGVNSALVGALGFAPLMSNVNTQTVADAPLVPAEHVPKMPPVIYSHGMLGNRSCYSSPCIDLASHGFVVFALEHADGTACLNCYPDKTVVEFKHAPRSAVIAGKPVRIRKGFNRSLVPSNEPKDFTQHELRNSQLEQRVREMRFVADCLERLEAGTHKEQLLLPPTLGELGLWSRLDLPRLACMGHSFGALTSIATSMMDHRFKACIAHDVWVLHVHALLLLVQKYKY